LRRSCGTTAGASMASSWLTCSAVRTAVASTRANRPAVCITASGCAASNACRHVYSCPLLMPYWRATSVGDAPGARLCAAIVCFCSIVQRRHSPRTPSGGAALLPPTFIGPGTHIQRRSPDIPKTTVKIIKRLAPLNTEPLAVGVKVGPKLTAHIGPQCNGCRRDGDRSEAIGLVFDPPEAVPQLYVVHHSPATLPGRPPAGPCPFQSSMRAIKRVMSGTLGGWRDAGECQGVSLANSPEGPEALRARPAP
jgi:hypothetical protein